MFYLCETKDPYLPDEDAKSCIVRISFAAMAGEKSIKIYCEDWSAFLMSWLFSSEFPLVSSCSIVLPNLNGTLLCMNRACHLLLQRCLVVISNFRPCIFSVVF